MCQNKDPLRPNSKTCISIEEKLTLPYQIYSQLYQLKMKSYEIKVIKIRASERTLIGLD